MRVPKPIDHLTDPSAEMAPIATGVVVKEGAAP